MARCRELGFALAGIADVSPTRYAAELRAWLDAGRHGTMSYLSEQLGERLDPQRVLSSARSVVMVADRYAGREPDVPLAPGRGRIARYARGRDYHGVIKKRLHTLSDELRLKFPGARFRSFADTAPVLEREYAARAGIGWVGKHTLVINPRQGSYLLLGGVLTSLDLQPSTEQRETPDHCGTCTRCIDACPTGAITPYSVDGSKCISYLTIERREPIDSAFHEPIGSWIFGCDVCQEVCPHNAARGGPALPEVLPAYTQRRDSFDLLAVLGWNEENRRRDCQTSALKRATLEMMKRNAIIVAGNAIKRGIRPHLADALLDRLRELAADRRETPLVRSTAAAVHRIASGRGD